MISVFVFQVLRSPNVCSFSPAIRPPKQSGARASLSQVYRQSNKCCVPFLQLMNQNQNNEGDYSEGKQSVCDR